MQSITVAILLVASLAVQLVASQTQPNSRLRSNLAPKLKSSSSGTTLSTTTTTARPSINARSSRQSSNSSNSSPFASNARLESFVEDELPADFYEMPPERLDLGMNATGRAPVPILNVAVLQNGQMIDSAINVHPGTPLEMVIYLDDKSAKVYGLLASYLKVQDDTFRQREEVIISNGCSIDTYIFGNFESNPEDQSLRAKFKAFKFPDSNFVRFIGTVNVCIKQCAKLDCNGAKRKRRSNQASSSSSSSSSIGNNQDNRLVMTVSTVLRISNPGPELQRLN